jgi:intracellular sulfur oxidation DsrE/DsrF family protein
MSNEQQFSDEYLNSFVDNELTIEEKSRVYITIHQDETLNRRVCELRKIHDVVQLAYKNLPVPPSSQPSPRKPTRLRHGVAAGLVFVLGVLFSWFEFGSPSNALRHNLQSTAESLIARAAHTDTSASPAQGRPAMHIAAGDRTQEMKVLFHLNSGKPEHIKNVLDEAENLLQLYEKQNQPARVEIITNGQGLSLLLADRSPFPARVSQMQKRYHNLVFAACQNSMEKYSDLGLQTRLLPGIIVIDSGVAQIIRLQQEGWAYIQV